MTFELVGLPRPPNSLYSYSLDLYQGVGAHTVCPQSKSIPEDCSSVYSNHKRPKNYIIVFGGYGDVMALLKYRWALSAFITLSSGPTRYSPAQNQVLNFEVTINDLFFELT